MNKSKLKNNYKTFALPLVALVASVGMLMSSCKKKEVVPYEQDPVNRITTYRITNAPEAINGVVDDIDNTITVEVPYYLSINLIVPEIKLADGATLIDAQGNSIDVRENLDPVPFDTVGYTYRVKDDKNNIRKYTLITRIAPYKDALKMGYFVTRDANGNVIADDVTEKEAAVNSRITIFGNLESSANTAKLTLVNKQTNVAVPNALSVKLVARNPETHYITADISASTDSGYYYIIAEHQGRKDTLPTIHLVYTKPFFGFLPKPLAQGDTVTMKLATPNENATSSGVNTGVARAYIILAKSWLVTRPANFPEELFTKQIDLQIISQNRTEIKFIFPEVIPAGIYEVNMGSGMGQIQYTGFGIYFDFNSTAWGNTNLLGGMPYAPFEIKPNQ
ncbi:hypothetical protein GCM10023149_23470 [Mucilaginibacter gynuensis]|uniref:DUF1735 domain-containing protein n=1 Tax=Mucilaginibacter gynuensis TaxID=1302236 RepID=A0ABP8GF83_9SPHI